MAGGGVDHGPYGGQHGGYQMNQGYSVAPQGYRGNSEKIVSVFCEANPNYRLAMRTDGIVLAFKNLEDPKQQWVMINLGDKFKDQEGYPAFSLVNKASGHAMAHGETLGDAVTPQTYQANALDNSILWSQGRDLGKDFKAIRLVNNIHLNLDADHGDRKHGGVEDGNRLLIHSWNKQENQKWKIVDIATEEVVVF